MGIKGYRDPHVGLVHLLTSYSINRPVVRGWRESWDGSEIWDRQGSFTMPPQFPSIQSFFQPDSSPSRSLASRKSRQPRRIPRHVLLQLFVGLPHRWESKGTWASLLEPVHSLTEHRIYGRAVLCPSRRHESWGAWLSGDRGNGMILVSRPASDGAQAMHPSSILVALGTKKHLPGDTSKKGNGNC